MEKKAPTNIGQLGLLSPIYGGKKHVPNHQAANFWGLKAPYHHCGSSQKVQAFELRAARARHRRGTHPWRTQAASPCNVGRTVPLTNQYNGMG